MNILKDGNVIVVGDPNDTAEIVKGRRLKLLQIAARRELIATKSDAIDFFVRGETYPDALKTHVESVKAVLKATVDDPLPTLPPRPDVADVKVDA